MSNEITAPITIETTNIEAPITIETTNIEAPITLGYVGPPGPAGAAGPNTVTSSTTSDGTANLSLSNVTTATAEVTGTLIANHIHGNIAGSVYAHVRAGENLAKGDPVYISGSHGSGSTLIPEVSKADASNAAKMPAVGIMDAAVSANANGHMVITGTITELNTNAYAVNAELYVASGGGFTATPPSARAQPVARVERANTNNGAIIVKVNGLSASDATSNTLVRRNSSGAASFGDITANGVITASGFTTNGQVEFNGTDAGDSLTFNMVNYTYGTGAAAAAHRIALGAGTTGAALFQAATVAAARDIIRTRVQQAADLSNATTTYADTDLVLTLEGGVDYLIRGQFDLVSTAGTTGWKLQLLTSQNVNALSTTANSLGWVSLGGSVAPINLANLTTADFVNFTGSSTRRAQVEIRLNIVANGTARIRFAQNAGNTTPASVFKAGSFWTAERL